MAPVRMSEASMIRIAPAEIARIARFVAVGVLNTAVGYGIFFALISVRMAPELALLFATVLGVAFNFFTNRQLVFAGRGLARLPRFLLVYGVSYGLNALLLRATGGRGYDPACVQLTALPVIVCATYLAMRYYVFPEKHQ